MEITEAALMTDLEHGARQLKLLRSLGVQIALDDFGTGHSSLAYLQQLPIDRLKIDGLFVKDISASDERPALLSNIIRMGLNMGCWVMAEGVETVEQALALSAMNCEEAQGFLFAKPLPAGAPTMGIFALRPSNVRRRQADNPNVTPMSGNLAHQPVTLDAS